MKILRILLSIILAAILSLGLISCEGKLNSEGDLTENVGSGNEDDAGNGDEGGSGSDSGGSEGDDSGAEDDGGSSGDDGGSSGEDGSGSGDDGSDSGDDGNDSGDITGGSDKPEPEGPKEFVMSPEWNPGTQNGVPKEMSVTFPVIFKLN